MIERIAKLFALFTELTGNDVAQCYLTQGEAREWLNAGFTPDDLRTMVRYRKDTIKEAGILRAMLRWRFIIGDVQRFAEDLPESKARLKKHAAATDREKVLRATGRTIERKQEPRTAQRVLSEAGSKAFEEFRKFRQQLEKP